MKARQRKPAQVSSSTLSSSRWSLALCLPWFVWAVRNSCNFNITHTELSGGASLCWWLPPPWGCSTGFIATPQTLGQQFLFTLNLWYALPAFNRGVSSDGCGTWTRIQLLHPFSFSLSFLRILMFFLFHV